MGPRTTQWRVGLARLGPTPSEATPDGEAKDTS